MTDVWVVGAGGLLGSALVRRARSTARLFSSARIPWGSPEAVDVLRAEADRFHRQRADGHPWVVVWAAGAAVIASTPDQLEQEQQVLLEFAEALARRGEPHGCLLFASSASVYGTSRAVASDELSPVAPLSGYARAKLAQEDALRAILAGRVPLATARLATLYGPGQDVTKGQGLISSMCHEALTRRTVSIFVPMDTTRDYLYTDDAATRCLHVAHTCLARAEDVTRVVASGRPTTIGEIARTVQAVAHRRSPLLQVVATGSAHARHVALRTTDRSLAALPTTPLPNGVAAVYRDLVGRYQRASTAGPMSPRTLRSDSRR
ncbi:NAD-dependent epimerase/dehydratase family protein [Cellulomonas soli]|uniref:NAD-dependent epimerase/dehydratase domain-containing protein n=1 Tax=Cellulomonas soli TaxID=931535 RepID=A0A512P824_9CELL|nr:NAD(P)-dependent oxidoreductase [Cellulomonas soli]NYI57574.1 UDP-glucose 4-epimerase [Cellulomonas soli]GEP67351.1 hypothetical protein CSO01_00660 [Cellulomonas soli]